MSTTNIYVLRLQGGKYYIGKTDNVMNRYQQHLNGNGSTWTRKYRPISLEKSIPSTSPFDEDKITKEYMAKYGIDSVRGGSYVSEILDDIQSESVQREIWAATDCCTQCGRKGHFVKDCNAKSDINGVSLYVYACDSCNREFENEYSCMAHERVCGKSQKTPTCYKCGYKGHYATTCYSKRSTYYEESYDSDSNSDSGSDSESEYY